MNLGGNIDQEGNGRKLLHMSDIRFRTSLGGEYYENFKLAPFGTYKDFDPQDEGQVIW